MATIIKLQRKGTRHQPFWWIVVTDERQPQGCVEQLGIYNNLRKPVQVQLDEQRAIWWMTRGAKPTASVQRLFQKHGIGKRAAESKSVGT